MLHARTTSSPSASALATSAADSDPGLSQTSPTRFRVEGLPGYFASFELKDGRAVACTTVEPGRPSRTLLREGS